MLKIGINIDGAIHHDGHVPLSIHQQFEMIRGNFHYVEKTLHPYEKLADFLEASSIYEVPLEALGVIFQPGKEDGRALEIIQQAATYEIPIVNCQVKAPGHQDDQASTATMGELYLRMLDKAGSSVRPCLEPHVDMWLEQFHRVERLADWLDARNAPLHLTIDHSHLIFRIDDIDQLRIAGIRSVAEGRKFLWPQSRDALYTRWLERGLIAHAHARSVQIQAPPNRLAERAPGLPGRGIQYPIAQPEDGTAWNPDAAAPWKDAVGQMLEWCTRRPDTLLQRISCEFIPYPDYGGGARYSIWKQNLACAEWLRATMAKQASST